MNFRSIVCPGPSRGGLTGAGSSPSMCVTFPHYGLSNSVLSRLHHPGPALWTPGRGARCRPWPPPPPPAATPATGAAAAAWRASAGCPGPAPGSWAARRPPRTSTPGWPPSSSTIRSENIYSLYKNICVVTVVLRRDPDLG